MRLRHTRPVMAMALIAGLTMGLQVGSARTVAPAPTAAQGKIVQIVISNVAFAPAAVTVMTGDTIEWLNKDIVDHTATARDKAWDLTIPVGKKASVVVKAAGTVEYYCRFHPNMTGQVVVRAKPKP